MPLATADPTPRPDANPRVRLGLLAFMVFEIAILAATGVVLFFALGLAESIWAWELTPFNARFIGAFYLAAAVGVTIAAAHGRWAPARVIAVLALVVSILMLSVSLASLDRFLFDRWVGWAWFVVYAFVPVFTTYALLVHRRHRAMLRSVPLVLRAMNVVVAVLFGAYGIGLLFAPVALTRFWPWPVDAFHARLYAAIFVALGAAGLTLYRRGAPADLLTAGATILALGLWVIAGTLLTDASRHSVDWGSAGTWLWLAAFAVIAAVGLVMVLASRGWGARTSGTGWTAARAVDARP